MITETSREAYNSIKPKIGHKQTEVLEAIKELQPCTDKQIARYLDFEINRVTPRRGELYKLDQIEPAGKIKVNGFNAMTWKIKIK